MESLKRHMSAKDVLIRAGVSDTPPATRMSGGDVAAVWRAGGFVVKFSAGDPRQCAAESEGLKALENAGISVPEVIHVEEHALVMRYLAPGPPNPKQLGAMIGRLHQRRGDHYGWGSEVFLGRFALESGQDTDWPTYWCEQRIYPLLQATSKQLGPLYSRIKTLLRTYRPPVEGPCLLHGDLWAGNFLDTEDGPALIDPSVWWGERAVDLAMMDLFGGFAEALNTYEEVAPIPREVREAVPFYQLYYLLAHVHFFGASYLNSVERVLKRYKI